MREIGDDKENQTAKIYLEDQVTNKIIIVQHQ